MASCARARIVTTRWACSNGPPFISKYRVRPQQLPPASAGGVAASQPADHWLAELLRCWAHRWRLQAASWQQMHLPAHPQLPHAPSLQRCRPHPWKRLRIDKGLVSALLQRKLLMQAKGDLQTHLQLEEQAHLQACLCLCLCLCSRCQEPQEAGCAPTRLQGQQHQKRYRQRQCGLVWRMAEQQEVRGRTGPHEDRCYCYCCFLLLLRLERRRCC